MNNVHTRWLLLFSILLSFLVNFYVFYSFSFNHLSPDSLRISLGSEYLRENGMFRDSSEDAFGYSPDERAVDIYYPVIQIVDVGFSYATGIDQFVSINYLVLILATFIPVLVFLIARKAGLSISFSLYAFFAALFSGFFARSIILTVQNLFGYVAILLVIYFYYTLSLKKFFIISFLMSGLLFFVHHLSAAVLAISLGALLVHYLWREGKIAWLAVSFTGLGLLGIIVFFVVSISEIVLAPFQSGFVDDAGELLNAQQVWRVFSVFGYVYLSVCVLGILKVLPEIRKHTFLVVYGLCVLAIAYIPLLFNFVFHPDRLIAYLWIVLAFLFPFGISYLFVLLKKSSLQTLSPVLISAVCLIMIFQGFAWRSDALAVFGETYQPNTLFLEIVEVLRSDVASDSTVLTMLHSRDKALYALPHYIDNPVTGYYTGSIYSVFEQEISSDILDASELAGYSSTKAWLMSYYPDEAARLGLYEDFGVTHYIFAKDARVERIVENSDVWRELFSNDGYYIYEYVR